MKNLSMLTPNQLSYVQQFGFDFMVKRAKSGDQFAIRLVESATGKRLQLV